MHINPRLWTKKIIRRFGYDLHSLPVDSLTLRDLEFDLSYLVKNSGAVVLDVGANAGQTIDLLLHTLNKPKIYSFEPNPVLAASLKQRYADSVVVEVTALGSKEGKSTFHVLEKDDLSSILAMTKTEENPFSDTAVREIISVPVTTVDTYVNKNNITHIDLFKIDTQGFDLEVLRGAAKLLGRRGVGTILVEVNFMSLYEGQASFCEIERFLAANRYRLLTLYEIARLNSFIGWATACFRSTEIPASFERSRNFIN